MKVAFERPLTPRIFYVCGVGVIILALVYSSSSAQPRRNKEPNTRSPPNSSCMYAFANQDRGARSNPFFYFFLKKADGDDNNYKFQLNSPPASSQPVSHLVCRGQQPQPRPSRQSSPYQDKTNTNPPKGVQHTSPFKTSTCITQPCASPRHPNHAVSQRIIYPYSI